jgi:hypothetical protein
MVIGLVEIKRLYFGKTLEEVLTIESNPSHIPYLVQKCCDFIEENGMIYIMV